MQSVDINPLLLLIHQHLINFQPCPKPTLYRITAMRPFFIGYLYIWLNSKLIIPYELW